MPRNKDRSYSVRAVLPDGTPISGALIAIERGSVPMPDIGLITDQDGCCSISMPEGEFNIMLRTNSGRVGRATLRTCELAPVFTLRFDRNNKNTGKEDEMNEILTVSNEVEDRGSRLESVSNPEVELGMEFGEEPPRELASLPGSAGAPSAPNASAPSLLLPGTEPIQRLPKRRSALESIIGDDERERITDTDNAPWRMICSLVIRGQGRTAVGTGWFAGPRTIVTAGHCVFHSMIGGWAREILIYPGRDGRRKPFGELKSTRFSTTNKWLQDQSPDFDYAAIHLGPEAEQITKQTGWFSTTVQNDAALKNQRVNVSGYPGDKGIGELMGSEQWFHAKQVVYVTPYRIFYDVDTMGGQSGAPTWIQTAEGPKVVGIHAYGVGGSVGLNANSAPRITQDVLNVIKGWVEKA